MRKVPVDCAPTPARERSVRAVLPAPEEAPVASPVAATRSLVEVVAELTQPAPAPGLADGVPVSVTAYATRDGLPQESQTWASEWMSRLMPGSGAPTTVLARYSERTDPLDGRVTSGATGQALASGGIEAGSGDGSPRWPETALPIDRFVEGGWSSLSGENADALDGDAHGGGTGSGWNGAPDLRDPGAEPLPVAQVPLPGSASLVALGCLGWFGWAGVKRRGTRRA